MARTRRGRLGNAIAGGVVLALAIALAGCGAVRARRSAPERSGFLGDYAGLAAREGYEAQEVYVNPRARWSQYTAVQIDSITLWADRADVKLSGEERQMLTDLAYAAIHAKIGEKFRIVDRPGPDVLRLRGALTQQKAANVPLRVATTIVPQVLVIGTAVGLSADTAYTVGTATVEAELVDSLTGERLAASVDQRAGTKALLTMRTFQKWGDVEAACDFWAERLAAFLLKEGVQPKAGASPDDAADAAGGR